jgi:hypothetical protein
MTLLRGIIQQGQVVLQVPSDLPDGTEVTITPLHLSESGDEDGPMSPEEIARVLALIDQVEPLDWTEKERTDWEADLQAKKEWAKPPFNEHADKLRAMWE